MFTGIVEELGALAATDGARLRFRSVVAHTDAAIGDSIAVNGTCLTVVELHADGFSVDVVPETLRRTNLGDLPVGGRVNLERSMRANARIGGHFVQGHVDGVGHVRALTPEGESVVVQIEAADAVAPYLVPKGFIAVDGASLTIVDVDGASFTIALIPHTRAETTLGLLVEGTRVNLEADILGKYVERMLASRIK